MSQTLWNRRIPTRDGEELAADVLLPPGDGPFPCVVTRTPYGRGRALGGFGRLTQFGYAYVAVDVRGRGDSSGDFTPFVDDGLDGYDVIEWVADQDWSSGRVGMCSGSYEGLTQWWTARTRPPHLACIVPQAIGVAARGLRTSADSGVPVQYWAWLFHTMSGRTWQHPGAVSWERGMAHLPLRTLSGALGTTSSAWEAYVDGEIDYLSPDHALSDEDWAGIDIPVMIGVGWWDDQYTFDTWRALQKSPSRLQSRLLVGAWDHAGNIRPRPVLGGLDVAGSVVDPLAAIEDFLAEHLKDATPADPRPRCSVWHTGLGQWEELYDWPDATARQEKWYIHSGGHAQTLHGDGWLDAQPPEVGERGDTLRYDPEDPGRDLTDLESFAWSDPSLDHRYLHRRMDTLVYTSSELTEAVACSGQVSVELWVSSDRPDTDVFVELSDVQPDGRAIAFGATGYGGVGAQRLRYRDGTDPSPLEVDRPVLVTMPVTWLHHTFQPGHRIRVAVRSSWFVSYARNLNTGGHWADESEAVVAHNTVHHDRAFPSHVVLPVVPGEES